MKKNQICNYDWQKDWPSEDLSSELDKHVDRNDEQIYANAGRKVGSEDTKGGVVLEKKTYGRIVRVFEIRVFFT